MRLFSLVYTNCVKARLAKLFIIFLATCLVLWNTFLTLASLGQEKGFAIICMGWGLAIVWIFGAGYFMYRKRDEIRARVLAIPLSWKVKFVLLATILALLEEVVTVTLTNMAPVFGSQVGEAYITASANYFDVVLFHSVVIFIPLFIAWSYVLAKYDFKPFAVFILFGVTGIFAEMSLAGPQAFLGFAQWIFVYGLMVYIPVYCLPKDRGAKAPKWWQYLTAIPVTFLLASPLLVLIVFVIAGVLHHPSIHFAP